MNEKAEVCVWSQVGWHIFMLVTLTVDVDLGAMCDVFTLVKAIGVVQICNDTQYLIGGVSRCYIDL